MRGKADRMRLRIWMQDGGTLLQSSKWYSHKNSGKSCSSTSSTLNVPCTHQSVRSLSALYRRSYGSSNAGAQAQSISNRHFQGTAQTLLAPA